MRSLKRREHDERGAVAILVALLATSLFVLAAIVVDLGLARDVRRQAQVAADASALAGANALYPVSKTCSDATPSPCLLDAENAAKDYASDNYGVSAADWSSSSNQCLVPTGSSKRTGSTTQCISFDSLATPSKVRVQIPTRRVPFGLGTVTGADSVDVAAAARAALVPGARGRCALCFLGPVSVGNGDFDIRGSSLHVNGNLDIGVGSYWTAAHIYVAGTWPASDTARLEPVPEKAEVITDPFATDPRFTPSTAGLSAKTGSPCDKGPGIYGDYGWGATENCTLAPGLYVVDGAWDLKNNSGVHGAGVTLYVRNGSLDFKNSGTVDLRAPTASEAAATGGVQGWVVIYARTNTSYLSLQGNGTTANDGSGCSTTGTPSLIGGIYGPQVRLSVNGNSCLAIDTGPIVVLGVDPSSSGDFNGTKSGLFLRSGVDVSIENQPKIVALDQ